MTQTASTGSSARAGGAALRRMGIAARIAWLLPSRPQPWLLRSAVGSEAGSR